MAIAYKRSYYDRLNKPAWFKLTGYKPHDGQNKVHNDSSRFRVMVAGRRWGKTVAAAKEAECMIMLPGTRGWVVSKTYDLTMKVIREIYSDIVIKLRQKPTINKLGGPVKIAFPWGSVVEGKTAEHPESLLGEGLDWLIFDECATCKQSVWEQYLRPTLSDRQGWALFITTPRGYNWVYDIWKRGYDSDYPEWQSFKSPSWDNPYLSKDDIAEARHTLTSATFMQEYGADFTLASGQVYNEFDEVYHILPANEMAKILDPTWRRYRAIDFGYENPFVCLYITVDPDDRLYVYKEYYQRHRTVEAHAKALNQDEGRYEYSVCDPSGASARATLLENGISTIAFPSLVNTGLEMVRQQLKIRDDGKPGLYVSSDCKNVIKEFSRYVYPDTGKDEPVKEYDHCMDALRYFVSYWKRGSVVHTISRRMGYADLGIL